MAPTPTVPGQQPAPSPLDQYMQNYGARLHSMLAGDPNQGRPPGPAAPAGAAGPPRSALQGPAPAAHQKIPHFAVKHLLSAAAQVAGVYFTGGKAKGGMKYQEPK
ncbi:MAG TPA: hypothetical protein VLH80_07510 [Nitrospiraceae bacterium]|nr:hypothetical protein [Nitrospiraceae bacterium]